MLYLGSERYDERQAELGSLPIDSAAFVHL